MEWTWVLANLESALGVHVDMLILITLLLSACLKSALEFPILYLDRSMFSQPFSLLDRRG